MNITDKVIVVTGGARGAGEALCRRFVADGARQVVIADRSIFVGGGHEVVMSANSGTALAGQASLR